MVAATGVRKNLNAIQTHEDMWTTSKVSQDTRNRLNAPRWSKELLAQLDTDTGVDGTNNSISEWYFSLHKK